jgi:exopolysaccharide biosynthesis protein
MCNCIGGQSTSHLRVVLFLLVLAVGTPALAQESVEQPFPGVTHITRMGTVPMHILRIDLATPGLGFKLTPPGGTRETIRQTTLEFLNQERAQIAVNAHFFLPFPSSDLNADVIGLAASEGKLYSKCEKPAQSYALVANAPAISIDRNNRASVVRCGDNMEFWNTLSGSAQIITNGVVTIPEYSDAGHPEGTLTAGGDGNYSNNRSWYELARARTVIDLSRDNRTLFLFTADDGMAVSAIAQLLLRDYAVFNALNLDGGGSTSLATEDAASHTGRLINKSSDSPGGRAVASSLAIFVPAAVK